MTTLVAILGTGKGTWAEVHSLIELGSFEKIVLFIDGWAAAEYRNEHNAIVEALPQEASAEELATLMHQKLKEHAHSELDVAVNIASGSGKQHAALLAAVLRTGAGVRLVTFERGQFSVLF